MRRTVLLALVALAVGCARPAPPDGPNVVLVSIDTLRADHLASWGYARQTSPTIDRLVREGTTFTHAYSAAPWTVPSHMSMLTGLPASVHGVDRPGRTLAAAHETLAERFRDAGWDTAAFVTGPTLHAAFGFDQGFARYENTMAFAKGDFVDDDPTLPGDAVRHRSHEVVTGPAVRTAVDRWLGTEARAPFFLFVHLWDPHYDYIPPPPWDRAFDPDYDGTFDFSHFEQNPAINPGMPARERTRLIALYDGEIGATDAILAEVLAALARRDDPRGTLVVLTSDHGEEFFEHGKKGHMKQLYEESIHVPLVFWSPGRIPAGRKVDAVLGAVHLMPTILGLAGVASGATTHGRDLSAVVRGGEPPSDLWALAELAHGRATPLYAVREGTRKTIGGLADDPPAQVYDLVADPGEQAPHPADATERAAFVARVREATGSGAHAAPEAHVPDAETARQLKALGYVE